VTDGRTNKTDRQTSSHGIVRTMHTSRAVKIAVKCNKNLAIANRSRVSFEHDTLRASIGLNITP